MECITSNHTFMGLEIFNDTTYTPYETTSTDDMFTESTSTASTTTDFILGNDVSLDAEGYALLSTYMSIAIVGLILNLSTIFIISLGKNVSQEVKIQLVNLAIADLLMSIFDPLKNSLLLFPDLSFLGNLSLCRFYIFLKQAAHNGSLFCNAALSLERFVIIFFPFKASKYSKSHKFIVIAIIWICASLPSAGNVIDAEIVQDGDISQCVAVGYILPFEVDVWLNTLQYLLPAGIIIVVYFVIYIKLCFDKSNRTKRHLPAQWQKDFDKVSEMIYILLVFQSWCPFYVFLFIYLLIYFISLF